MHNALVYLQKRNTLNKKRLFNNLKNLQGEKKMKKIIFLLSLLLVFSFLAFGEEKVTTLKGTIKYDSSIHSKLVTQGETYELMMPRFLLVDIKEGENIEVEGYAVDEKTLARCGYTLQKEGSEKFFYVTKLTYNGKTVDVNDQKGGMMRDGYGHRGRGRWFR